MLIDTKRCISAALAALVLGGCQLTAPANRESMPLLSALDLSLSATPPGTPIGVAKPLPRADRYLQVRATPVPMLPSAIPAGRSVIIVTTSGGDTELQPLYLFICLDDAHREYVCNSFSVGLRPGSDARSLISSLSTFSPTVTSMAIDSSSIGLFIEQGDVFEAMARAKRWPGARWVTPSGIFPPPGPPRSETALSIPRTVAYMPIIPEAVVPHDGVLQARPGDSVWVRYSGDPRQSVERVIVLPE